MTAIPGLTGRNPKNGASALHRFRAAADDGRSNRRSYQNQRANDGARRAKRSGVMNFTPIDPVKALYWSAVINGVVSFSVMVMMMHMARRQDIMGSMTLPEFLRSSDGFPPLQWAFASSGWYLAPLGSFRSQPIGRGRLSTRHRWPLSSNFGTRPAASATAPGVELVHLAVSRGPAKCYRGDRDG